MKSSPRFFLLACLGLLASAACPAVEILVNVPAPAPKPGGRAGMREAPTKEDVLERRAKAPSPFAPNTVFVAPDQTETQVRVTPSLAGTALLLNDGNQWTMLPRRSVLRFPDEVKQHIREGKAGKLVTWEQFQNANRARILSVPMTDAHLSGKQPITEEEKKKWATIPQMMVTTYAGNPVALPLPPPAPVALESKSLPSAKP